MKIAVIGADGLVGSAVCKKLNATGITRDNYELYIGKSFDVIINANGNSSKHKANDDPQYDFTESVESVNDTMFDFGFKKYVYISSYDAHMDNSYGLHKKLSEEIVKHYSDFIILRCPIIIGKKMRKGFLFDALCDNFLYVNSDSEYQIITNTELAKIIKVLIDKNVTNKTYYVGSRDTLRVGDLAILLGKKIFYRDDAKYENYTTDVSEIQSLYATKLSAEYVRDVT
jgi:nucleoside-diphosphate-sugar epimerase